MSVTQIPAKFLHITNFTYTADGIIIIATLLRYAGTRIT
jgi:hypothetical protein